MNIIVVSPVGCCLAIPGLSDGSLLLIQNRSAAGQHARWVVCDAIRGFADRHVLQLVVAHSKGLLLSLTEQGEPYLPV